MEAGSVGKTGFPCFFSSNDSQEVINENDFKTILLSSIGDSIKGILEEEGTPYCNVFLLFRFLSITKVFILGIDSRGLFDDIKDVVKLAKDMGFDESESFFRYP